MAVDLIGLGLATLDHLCLVESFADPVGQLRLKAFDIEGGGPAASALAAAARLGLRCELWAQVGTGPLADQIIAGLRRAGVDTGAVRQWPDSDGPLVLVLVDGRTAERRFQVARGWPRRELEGLPLNHLAGARCLLVDGAYPAAACEAARRARELGVPVVADLGNVEGPYRELVALVDHLIVDEACGARLGHSADPERACLSLLELGPRVAAITLGARGCVCADAGGVRRRRAFPVEAVDTTGAGDTFHGAYCVGVVEGWDLDRTIAFASAVAALCCTRLGGRAGVPDRAGVERFLAERETRAG